MMHEIISIYSSNLFVFCCHIIHDLIKLTLLYYYQKGFEGILFCCVILKPLQYNGVCFFISTTYSQKVNLHFN